MSNTETNRQIVQQGLDRRAKVSRAKAKEAAMDKAEKDFRALCNSITEERRKQAEAENEARIREQEASMREQEIQMLKQEKEAERARLKEQRRELRRRQWNLFIFRTFGSVAVAGILCILSATENMSTWLAMVGVILAAMYFVWQVTAFVISKRHVWNRKEPQKCGSFLCNIPN